MMFSPSLEKKVKITLPYYQVHPTLPLLVEKLKNQKLLQRLHYLIAKPLRVMGPDYASHAFVPRFGIGAVSVIANDANAADVVDQAEQLALAANLETDGQTNWVVHQP